MTQIFSRLMASVRVRVTLTALMAVAAVLLLVAGVLAAELHRDRQRVMTAAANQEAQEVVSFNPQLRSPLMLPVKATVQSGLIQVIVSGHVLGASHALRNVGPLWSPGKASVQDIPASLADIAADGRVVAVPVTAGNVHATVVVVTSIQQYDHSISLVVSMLEWTSLGFLAVLAVICWFAVGRSLRPIELMRREVAEVANVRGMHRVAEPAGDDEVARLARTLNSMLDRLQASTDRERRFVSDASHELRSPIANIRTELEVALHTPSIADWPEVAGEVLGQNERMEQLVSGLLLLARSDEGSLIRAAQPTSVVEAVRELVAARPGTPPVLVEVAVDAEGVAVDVPRVYLERMVANLVDNARRFASTAVTVGISSDAEHVEVRVSDDGPGVPPADRSRIFERFVRLDEARHRGQGGFGLGLAIVGDLSRFYRGSIEVTDHAPGAEFLLRLPAGGIAGPQDVHPAGALDETTEADTLIGPGESASIDVH